jgi:acetylornithine deacetylase
MARVLAALEAYQRDVAPTFPAHRLCGQATISVGTIVGGLSVNTVPDLCTIEIDRRLLPGEDNDTAYRHVIDYVARYPGVDFQVDHEAPFMRGATLADGPNQPLADRLTGIVRGLVGRCEQIGVPFGTDASKIFQDGVPAVVFGPGSIDQAHTADEWLPLDELEQASEALYQFGRTGIA